MKLLESKKINIPEVYFVTDRSLIPTIPPGVPFIYGSASSEPYIVRLLEYEALWNAAVKTGYSFNFAKILADNGYRDIVKHGYTFGTDAKVFMSTKDWKEKEDIDLTVAEQSDITLFKEYVRDSACYVNIEKLKELKIIPTWVDTIEQSIIANIQNYATYNPYMYNKKLEGVYGSVDATTPAKNLIIIDFSGSIPKAVSSTCLTLSKNLAESFYADILITGSISKLYDYEEIQDLDIETIYSYGMGNEGKMFKALVEKEKTYNTIICFGDNDNPSSYGVGLSDEDGKKVCKWKVNHLISFHTRDTKELAGYCRWFSPVSEERISRWVRYID